MLIASSRWLAITLLSYLVTVVSAEPSHSQAAVRVPVTVALVDEMPLPGAPFVILRRPGTSPSDVILLPRTGASPRMLSDAVRALLLARQRSGDHPQTREAFRVRPAREPREGTRGVIPWTVRVMRDLRAAAPIPLHGIGSVPAVQIWLPPQDAG